MNSSESSSPSVRASTSSLTEMFLIFSLNRLDVLPLGDLGLRVGVQKIYNMKALPSPDKVSKLGKKWQPFETIGTWYTWRSMDECVVAY